MSSYFQKLSEYYNSEQADKDNKRFVRQVKNTFITTAVILGIVFFLIIVLVVALGIESILN
jgi:hypothetical protein